MRWVRSGNGFLGTVNLSCASISGHFTTSRVLWRPGKTNPSDLTMWRSYYAACPVTPFMFVPEVGILASHPSLVQLYFLATCIWMNDALIVLGVFRGVFALWGCRIRTGVCVGVRYAPLGFIDTSLTPRSSCGLCIVIESIKDGWLVTEGWEPLR